MGVRYCFGLKLACWETSLAMFRKALTKGGGLTSMKNVDIQSFDE